jgi:hypothetical protein
MLHGLLNSVVASPRKATEISRGVVN